MLGVYTGDTVISTGVVPNTEAVVLTCIRVAATSLPDGSGEGVGRLRDPVPAGGPIITWPERTN